MTSAGAGPSIGKHILMSYLPPEHAVVGEQLLGPVHGRALSGDGRDDDSTPVFDPDNARVRS